MKKINLFLGLAALLLLISGCTIGVSSGLSPVQINSDTAGKAMNEDLLQKYHQAVFHTNLGDFTVEFANDKTPITVNNFLNLAKSGFYSNVKFHRVVKGFMIQGGDPLSKDDSQEALWGTGSSTAITDEFDSSLSNERGTIAMANRGPNTGSCQFFINTADNRSLDGRHPVFGKVVSGMDTIDKIENVPVRDNGNFEESRPVSPVIITSIDLKK